MEHWQKLDQASLRQYQAGDMSGYKATRSAMGDMARSLERDPQLESILANRKRELGIAFESGRRLGRELGFTRGLDLGRGRGIEISTYPVFRRFYATARRHGKNSLACPTTGPVLSAQMLSKPASRRQREPCANQTGSSV